MWGQVPEICQKIIDGGIIPTRVGTSFPDLISRRNAWDHPHACGDKMREILFRAKRLGSSPRVWGQVYFFYSVKNCTGIIPTRVGTRTCKNGRARQAEDHPHACGDKSLTNSSRSFATGSSPRVWGQDERNFVQSETFRIIPTRVGTSLFSPSQQ